MKIPHNGASENGKFKMGASSYQIAFIMLESSINTTAGETQSHYHPAVNSGDAMTERLVRNANLNNSGKDVLGVTNYHLFGLEACTINRNPLLITLLSQDLVDIEHRL